MKVFDIRYNSLPTNDLPNVPITNITINPTLNQSISVVTLDSGAVINSNLNIAPPPSIVTTIQSTMNLSPGASRLI